MLPAPTSVVALSSAHAGARPVVVAVQLRYEMQCGWPGTGTVHDSVPRRDGRPERDPRDLGPGAGKARAERRQPRQAGERRLPPRKGILCDVIGPGG